MVNINGWNEGGERGWELGDIRREMGKDLCPHLSQTFPENINGGSRNDGIQKLILAFHGPQLLIKG